MKECPFHVNMDDGDKDGQTIVPLEYTHSLAETDEKPMANYSPTMESEQLRQS